MALYKSFLGLICKVFDHSDRFVYDPKTGQYELKCRRCGAEKKEKLDLDIEARKEFIKKARNRSKVSVPK